MQLAAILAGAMVILASGQAGGAADDVEAVAAYVRPRAVALESAADLDALMERIGSARLVLLGESSHGTSEYYTWRAEISKRLIEEKGFDFIAVEGDWPSCYAVNRYVKQLAGAPESAEAALATFRRWPRWMWANEETRELAEWLRRHNAGLAAGERVGFFGLDLYSMPESMDAVLEFKERAGADVAVQARRHYECLAAFRDDPINYARHIARTGQDCSANARAVVSLLRGHAGPLAAGDPKGYWDAKQNALLVESAERHYRAMVDPRMDSWNERVGHMHATLRRLLERHGPGSRGIVWAHNTHIGDATATTMAGRGMQNIGQLTRRDFGREEVVLVGFGTHRGTVVAGQAWGAPMETMRVPAAAAGSIEDAFNRVGLPRFLVVFEAGDLESPLGRARGNRAKGVVYNPLGDAGNYVPTVMPQRYDAFVFIGRTGALRVLELE